MKKMFLLCALVCVSQMYGMEPLFPETEHIYQLPKELQREITQKAILESKNVYDAIAMLKYLSTSFGIQLFDNLEDFTKLVHLLLDRFPTIEGPGRFPGSGFEFTSSTDIALLFNTPTSLKYKDLGKKLFEAAESRKLDTISQLIEDGADPNFTHGNVVVYLGKEYSNTTPLDYLLIFSYRDNSPEAVQLLLEAGAKPKSNDYYNFSNDIAIHLGKENIEKMKQLLQEYAQRKVSKVSQEVQTNDYVTEDISEEEQSMCLIQ